MVMLRILVLMCFCLVSSVAVAQTALDLLPQQEQSSDEQECEQDDCSNQEPEASAPISLNIDQVIDVEHIASSWEESINQWLHALGFTASWSAKALASTVVAIVAVLFIALISIASKRLVKKLIGTDKNLKFSGKRLKLYRRAIVTLVGIIIVLLGLIALLIIWWGSDTNLAVAEKVADWLATAINFGFAFFVLLVMFEVISAAIESYFHRLERKGSARLDTLIPIVRNLVYGVILLLFAITLISELGVNVTPILASAGVIGIAIGFAAQALIKDVLNGFIIVLEDLINVGDVATVGDRTGLVEKITLRKIQLRDLDGCVYTVPCSEITVVKNFTKLFSYYLFDIGVAYRENTDEVCAILQNISDEMMRDENYRDDILEPLEILGVDAFADSAVIIKARIKTKRIRQWVVGREFNRRMKHAFDQHNIEIPFPHQTLYFGEGKKGESPAARIVVADGHDHAEKDEPATH